MKQFVLGAAVLAGTALTTFGAMAQELNFWTWRAEDKAQYDRVEPVVDMTISHYHPTGLPQSEWYPRPIAATTLAKPFIQGGESILRVGLETEVDPALDDIAENNETIKNDLDQLARFPSDIATPEGNKRYGGHDAVEHVEDSTERIEDDRANGQRHHDRVPKALRLIAKDQRYALDLARSLGVHLEIVTTSAEIFRRAEAEGLGDLDLAAVIDAVTPKSSS